MSHVNAGDVVVKDLAALRVAAEEMGCRLIEKKNYNWYGQSVGDYPLPKGMTTADLGKCDYVIQVPGVKYEVGVVRTKDGNYTLAYDFFGESKGYHDGQLLLKKFGDKLCRLQQTYNKHAVLNKARANGYLVRPMQAAGGTLKYQLVKA